MKEKVDATVGGISDLIMASERNYYLRIAISQHAHDEVLILKRHPYIRVFVNSKLYTKLYEVLRLRKPYYLPVAKDRLLSYPFPLKCEGKYYDFEALVSNTQIPEVWISLPCHRFDIAISADGRHRPFDRISIGFGREGEQFVAEFRRAEKGLKPWDASLPWPVPHYYSSGAWPVRVSVLNPMELSSFKFLDKHRDPLYQPRYQYIGWRSIGGLTPDNIRETRFILWADLIDQFGEDSPEVKEGLASFAEGVLSY